MLNRHRVHLTAVGETYWEHLRFAAAVGTTMITAGLACLLHALLPGLFEDRASRAIERLSAVLRDRDANLRAAVLEGDAPGLLLLLLVSVLTALLPWIVGAQTEMASSLSVLSLLMPAAAVYAEVRQDGEASGDGRARLEPRRPSTARRRTVAIVGAGFSGTMVAVHLSRHPELDVVLVDRRPEPASGLAYSTNHPNHLLNVRAARMSAFPDDAGHFARWLAARGLGGPFDFAPRRTYRAYLEEQLAEATRRAASRLAFVSGEALDVARAGRRPVLRLADGRAIQADAVVLASGNLPPRTPAWARALSDDVYRPDPWSPGLCEGLAADDTVLLVGTGLTMIDTLVSLTDAGFQGRILATSRRGLLPRVHGPATAPPIAHHYGPHLPLSDLLHVFRRRADEAGWRAAMDEVRHSAQALWRAADEERRARFLRHLRPWWDVHRHRIAPAVADRLAELQAAGRFQVIAGKIEGAEAAEGRARVHLRLRGTQFKAAYDVRRIINCTGSDADLGRTGDPLLQRLTTSGAIRPDAHRLGVEIGARGEAIGRDGRPTPGLYALGPIARGRSWEATAVPELRVLAADMAQGLVEELVPAERDRAEL